MTLQVMRRVKVVVGPPGQEGIEIGGGSPPFTRITFQTKKTKNRHPNKCKIEIYNLDPTTAAFIESDERRNSVQLFAGYQGSLQTAQDNEAPGLIFSGEIRRGKARTALKGAERITTIQASDGGAGYRSARIFKSFSGQVTAFDVIKELGKAFNATIRVPADISDQPIDDASTYAGRAADVMQSLSESLGFNWWFEDDEIVIVSNDGDNGETAYLLSPETGLVDSPQKTDKGVNLQCLLNPSLRVKRVVEVQAKDVRGFYRIQQLEHRGDSWGGNDFNTLLECKAVTAGRSSTAAAKAKSQIAKVRAEVVGANYMFPSLSAAVAVAVAPAFGNVQIAEFSSNEFGLVTPSQVAKLGPSIVTYTRTGDLIFV